MRALKEAIPNAVLVLLLALAGCGRPEAIPVSSESAPVQTRTIRLFSWSDYFDPGALAGFEERTGIKVDYVSFGDLDELEARLRSQPGYYDIIVTDDSSMLELWELRLVRELDQSKIPNLKNIHERFKGLPFDPENTFSAPYLWGTTLVAFRNDIIEDPEASWSLLWNEDLKGHVMVMKDRLETLSVTLMSLGYPLNSEDEKEINEAADRAIAQLSTVDVRYGDDAEVRAGLADGSIWAAMCYSGDAAMVAAEHENISFFIPREGAPLWIDSFAIARDSNNVDAAHQFINYMLEGEIAAANSNHTYYASPNEAAVPFIDPDLLADDTINPPEEVLANCDFFVKPSVLREQLTFRAWLKVQKLVQQHQDLREKQARAVPAVDGESGAGTTPEPPPKD